MAVRDDFAAGEVLAAADLNDTFASKLPYSYGTATPSTTDSGFLWYDSNSTPPVPKYWNGSSFATLAPAPGLELVAAETFSAVSSISVNDCFSLDYLNYRFVYSAVHSTTASTLFRFRASGSDDSSSVYLQSGVFNNGATPLAATQNTTYFEFSTTGSFTTRWGSLSILRPYATAATFAVSAFAQTDGSTLRSHAYSHVHTNAASFDGITLYASTGTFTGELRIYGLKD